MKVGAQFDMIIHRLIATKVHKVCVDIVNDETTYTVWLNAIAIRESVDNSTPSSEQLRPRIHKELIAHKHESR